MSRRSDIRVEGVDRAIADLSAWELRRRGRLANAVEETLKEGRRMMRDELHQPGTGRWYTVSGKPHRASAPGEAPAKRTGYYRDSWKQEKTGLHGGDIQTDTRFARLLEYGTRNMAARPHVGPVSERLKGVWRDKAIEAIRR